MEVQASAASHASWQPSRPTGTVDPNLPCTQHKGQQSPSWQWDAMTAVPQTSQCQDGRLARCGWLCSVCRQHAQPLQRQRDACMRRSPLSARPTTALQLQGKSCTSAAPWRQPPVKMLPWDHPGILVLPVGTPRPGPCCRRSCRDPECCTAADSAPLLARSCCCLSTGPDCWLLALHKVKVAAP